MYLFTDLGGLRNNFSTSEWSLDSKGYQPVEKVVKTTSHKEVGDAQEHEPTSTQSPQKVFEPPIAEVWAPIGADTAPLQIWEGKVQSVEAENNVMNVLLTAKMGHVSEHTADIGLEWVSEQDMELVRPGAVFYLTLYKRTKKGGSIENSQELRFRRRPSWSPMEIERIHENAAALLSKMKPLPIAE